MSKIVPNSNCIIRLLIFDAKFEKDIDTIDVQNPFI